MVCCKIVWEVSNLFGFVDIGLKFVVLLEGIFYNLCIILFKKKILMKGFENGSVFEYYIKFK